MISSTTQVRQRKRKASSDSQACNVCCNVYTDKKRVELECEHCQFKACLQCYQRYMLSQAEPSCMHCKKRFTASFLSSNFSRTFVQEDLERHQTDILAEQEKLLFPKTMEYIAKRDVRDRLVVLRAAPSKILYHMERTKSIAATLVEHTGALQTFTYMDAWARLSLSLCVEGETMSEATKIIVDELLNDDLVVTIERQEVEEWFLALKGSSELLKFERQAVLDILRKFVKGLEDLLQRVIDETTQLMEKNSIILPVRCVASQCLGYVCSDSTSSSGIVTCKVCSLQQCVKCLTKTDGDNHVCNEERINTLKAVSLTTRTCPKCKELIEKIAGCDQMFCTHCNTAFDWSTNQVLHGRIHNPHYFEWLEKHQQQPPDEEPFGTEPGRANLFQSRAHTDLWWKFRDLLDNMAILLSLYDPTVESCRMHDHCHNTVTRNKNAALEVFGTVVFRKFLKIVDTAQNINTEEDIPVEQQFAVEPALMFRNERVMFLRGKITESVWKDLLHTNRRKLASLKKVYEQGESLVSRVKAYVLTRHQEISDIIDKYCPGDKPGEIGDLDDPDRKKQFERECPKLVQAALASFYDDIMQACRSYNEGMLQVAKEQGWSVVRRIVLPSVTMLLVDRPMYKASFHGESKMRVGRHTLFADAAAHDYHCLPYFEVLEKHHVDCVDDVEYDVVLHYHFLNLAQLQIMQAKALNRYEQVPEETFLTACASFDKVVYYESLLEKIRQSFHDPLQKLCKVPSDCSVDVSEALSYLVQMLHDDEIQVRLGRQLEVSKVELCGSKQLEIVLSLHQEVINMVGTVVNMVSSLLKPVVRDKYWNAHQMKIVLEGNLMPSGHFNSKHYKLYEQHCWYASKYFIDTINKELHQKDFSDTYYDYLIHTNPRLLASDHLKLVQRRPKLALEYVPWDTLSNEQAYKLRLNQSSWLDLASIRATFNVSGKYSMEASSFPSLMKSFDLSFGDSTVVMEVPKWLASCFFNTEEDVLTLQTPSVTSKLMSCYMFDATIAGTRVSNLEAICAAFAAMEGPWTEQVVDRMLCRLNSCYEEKKPKYGRWSLSALHEVIIETSAIKEAFKQKLSQL